jgi:23S rRNA (adenine2503-C2)-methyltransferase
MYKTAAAVANQINTVGDYTTPEPYDELNHNLMKAGFETLVFIASQEEDDGLITCGNAVLSGSKPRCEYSLDTQTTNAQATNPKNPCT